YCSNLVGDCWHRLNRVGVPVKKKTDGVNSSVFKKGTIPGDRSFLALMVQPLPFNFRSSLLSC
ncbi:MAG: hypothetical protein QM344_01655, partial [Bacillota bacterium]|nr:hypothetical protein [Bacillota bacterium]